MKNATGIFFGLLLMATSSYAAPLTIGEFKGKGCNVTVELPGYHLVADRGAKAVIVDTPQRKVELAVTPESILNLETISEARGFEIVPTRHTGTALKVDIQNNKITAYEFYSDWGNVGDREKTKVKCILK